VLHASHLGDAVWGFAAARDAQGRGVWITKDAVGGSSRSLALRDRLWRVRAALERTVTRGVPSDAP
jgi:hypothetical protein